MRTSFHHQPEAQRPNFQLFASWQADYPIFRGQSGYWSLLPASPFVTPRRDVRQQIKLIYINDPFR